MMRRSVHPSSTLGSRSGRSRPTVHTARATHHSTQPSLPRSIAHPRFGSMPCPPSPSGFRWVSSYPHRPLSGEANVAPSALPEHQPEQPAAVDVERGGPAVVEDLGASAAGIFEGVGEDG